MKILVDIGHPAHVHYFRNAIQTLAAKGHEFLITTRDKEVTLDLLRSYGLDYVCTGKNKAGTFNKFLTMLRNDWVIYREARRFKPDLFFSFFSPFAAQVGWFLRKPVIGFTDSEFARFSIKLTKPFTNYIFTPQCFEDDFGKNHFRFKGFMESFYLHPKYFTPDERVLQSLGVAPGEKFFIMRFVSFTAGHDKGETGIDDTSKLKIAEYLSKKGKLFISSEGALPPQFQQYKMKIAPGDFHSVLAYASLYVGEGVTTASECAQLGTPAVLINTLYPGYIKELERSGLVYSFSDPTAAFLKIQQIADLRKDQYLERRNNMLHEMIDCTAFLVWLIDNFPHSVQERPAETFNATVQ